MKRAESGRTPHIGHRVRPGPLSFIFYLLSLARSRAWACHKNRPCPIYMYTRTTSLMCPMECWHSAIRGPRLRINGTKSGIRSLRPSHRSSICSKKLLRMIAQFAAYGKNAPAWRLSTCRVTGRARHHRSGSAWFKVWLLRMQHDRHGNVPQFWWRGRTEERCGLEDDAFRLIAQRSAGRK